MPDATCPPLRMRYSFEARCRAVGEMVAGASVHTAAASVGASRATGYRWWRRFRDGGWVSLQERRPIPRRQPRRLSAAAEAEIVAARERSGAGPLTIGALLDRPASTVGKVLRRLGRSRLPRERPPVVRYERERPGELLHIDTKKLGRFWHVGKRILRDGVQRSPRAGWQHVHVAVDDHSRLAYVEVLPSDRQGNAIAFLERALGWYAAQGITVEEVMTDMVRPTARTPGERAAPCSDCCTCALVPTRRARTGRQSASSRRCCAAGPTPSPTRRVRTVPEPSPAGCGGTTDEDPTAPSVAVHRSAVSHISVVTTSSKGQGARGPRPQASTRGPDRSGARCALRPGRRRGRTAASRGQMLRR